ncbi:MAG: glycoside hydrolase family 2 protein [Clostridia bacterium]|nr:glycoside hydrolase family 2 protein [Clostridia bacterium]
MRLMQITDFKMDFGEHRGIPCKVPCSMYSVLVDNRLIDDPYYRDNEIKARELAKQSVSFYAEFSVADELLCKRNIILRFKSLDTLCRIELNGRLLGEVDNMHRTHEFDVKGIVLPEGNILRLDFRSALLEMEKKQAEHFLMYDLNCTAGHPHLRKAFYMSGWDWAPKLSDMGIMRDVELVCYDTQIIERVETRQIHNPDGSVRLNIKLHTKGEDDMARAVATLVSPGGSVYYCGLVGKEGYINIAEPNLWWPNNLGPQNLYKLTVNLYSDTEVVDSREMRIGLRTLTVSREKDEYGEEFALTVNGVKFFSMGANYVPEDSLIPHLTRERTEKVLASAKAANFNTIRVWGGAFYPPDWFFEICDEMGLVVWQDFMVACGNILLTEHNRENFIAEFIDNFTRIGHHASLGIVAGNNEIEEFIVAGDFDGEGVRHDYLELYESILPALMKEDLPDTFYWPSSPSSGGGFNDPQAEDRGDCHYWKMWSGGEPYEDCRNYYFRYMSEYGFESLPNIKTVRAFAEQGDMNIFSPVVEWHQKKKIPDGNLMMIKYAAGLYRYAHSFSDLIYVTQLVQADAIRFTAEHMRRHRGRCMGSIYWQFNDCWPVASWASLDYFGRWKALHYAAKKFYSPLLVSAEETGTRVKFSIANERRKPFEGRFSFSVIDTNLTVLFSDSFELTVPEMSASFVHEVDLSSVLTGRMNECFVCYSATDLGGTRSEGTTLFVKPKAFNFQNPNIRCEITGAGTKYTATLTASAFARSVELDFETVDAVFEDNYFDITSTAPVRVHFTTSAVTNVETLRRELKLRSVFDVGR